MRVLVLLALASGCRAHFVDERPLDERGAAAGDLAVAPEDLDGRDLAGAGVGVFAAGSFSGRAGHLGLGGAALYRRSDGIVMLELDDQFSVSPVPGPVLVLTSRDALGTMLDDSVDLELGPLAATTGAQAYHVPGGDGGRRVVFVFCRPYGVEVARAALE
jgi:hypothetical protein